MADKLLSMFGDIKKYWKTPAKGRYMSFKEIASLSIGGIGIRFIVYCVSNMIISIGNTLIGNTIGIDPSAMYVIYIISVLSGFPLTALRARMIDNAKSMKGKYRPYILSMGIPTVILGIGFIWMPYEYMSLTAKCIVVLLFNIGFQFFYNFMNDAYDSLINVLSPNTIERSDVCSIKAVVENLSPSIASIFLPIAARLITGDNTLYDLRVYRVLYPPMLLAGLAISVLIYVNTEEKIIQPKNRIIQVKFSDAFRAVVRNKYFWIISLAGWLGFLESSFNTIIGWMYNYQGACSAAQYAIIVAISGNASFWPNLVGPYFIRRFGKKKVLIYTNLFNIAFIAAMLPIVRGSGFSVIWVLLICTFVNQYMTSLGHLMNPSLNADIRDYQQYITGERIDGMFAAVGLIGSVITLLTSSVLPALYEKAGLNREVALSLGYDGSNVYEVLYNQEYFVHISSVLIIASIVGAVMNVLPFFFYDLTETKQKAMISVLKIRAMFKDYGDGVLTDERLVEGVELINDAKLYSHKQPHKITRKFIKEAEKTGDKEKIRSAKLLYREMLNENEKIEMSALILDELNRFSTEYGAKEYTRAKRIVAAGVNGFITECSVDKNTVKNMHSVTQTEKELKRNASIQLENFKRAEKTIKRYYPNGIDEFDMRKFDVLFAERDSAEIAYNETLKSIKSAKESGNKELVCALKNKLKLQQKSKSGIEADIKNLTDKYSVYMRAVKPYLDAQKTVEQKENFERFDELLKRYDEIKTAVV